MQVKIGYAMVLVAALMWGSIGIFVNGLTSLGLSSAGIAALRLLAGAVLLAPVLMVMGMQGAYATVKKGRSAFSLFHATPRALVSCAFVGVFGLAFANLGYYVSMREVGMSTASVLLYTSPVFGVAFGKILYGEAVTGPKLLSVALNIIGCVLAVTSGDLTGMHFSGFGVGAGVFAGLMGALLAVFSKIATEHMNPLGVTFYGFMFGGAAMLAISRPWEEIVAALSPEFLLLLLGFGLIPTALAYIFYMRGLSMGLEASKVPVVASFETVATVLVGMLLYDESSGAVKMIGICLVLLSIFAMNVNFAVIRSNGAVRLWRESMAFNGSAWRREKIAGYDEFINGGDWQTWMTIR